MGEHDKFGEFFKRLRLENGDTLRQFCQKNGLDPGNISKLERGVMPPPKTREKLEQYASYIGITEGSDEWYSFFDKASISHGVIPPDLMDDNKLVEKLPIVFRTLRGEIITEDKLRDLADLIKRS